MSNEEVSYQEFLANRGYLGPVKDPFKDHCVYWYLRIPETNHQWTVRAYDLSMFGHPLPGFEVEMVYECLDGSWVSSKFYSLNSEDIKSKLPSLEQRLYSAVEAMGGDNKTHKTYKGNKDLDKQTKVCQNRSMTDEVMFLNDHSLSLPAFGKSPSLTLEMGIIREAETRLIEAKLVNPATYSDLSHTFNESYRMLKNHLSNIGYQLLLAEKALESAKADVILGSYAEHLEGKPKSYGSTDLRNAFLSRDPAYNAATDRINQLKAFQSNFEGKVKVLENVVSYMKQKMYLVSRSGLGGESLYVTSGNKGK